jgi:hypothetical protein
VPSSQAMEEPSILRSTLVGETLNTPFKNPFNEPAQEIEVTDPTHPLFGRRFQLLSVFAPLHTPGHVRVAYRQQMVRSIPLLATSLSRPRPALATTLTSPALTELMSLAEACAVRSCPTDPKTSGGTGLHRSQAKSSRTASRSSRR